MNTLYERYFTKNLVIETGQLLESRIRVHEAKLVCEIR